MDVWHNWGGGGLHLKHEQSKDHQLFQESKLQIFSLGIVLCLPGSLEFLLLAIFFLLQFRWFIFLFPPCFLFPFPVSFIQSDSDALAQSCSAFINNSPSISCGTISIYSCYVVVVFFVSLKCNVTMYSIGQPWGTLILEGRCPCRV